MTRFVAILLFLFAIPFILESQTWNSFGNGFLNGGSTCLSSQEKLYIGTSGSSGITLTGFPTMGICSFDGSQIDSLGAGVGGYSGSARDAKWYNGKLIVGGDFSYAGGPTVWSIPHTGNLAAWDSLNGWSSITPLNNPDFRVNAIQEYQGNLFIGGEFVTVNNISCRRIAKWNGISWSNVGGGFAGNCYVNCMAVYHNQLYVGGAIGLPNGPNSYYYNIARWNGIQWDSVGGKTNFDVMALAVDTVRDVLYAAGGFRQVGGTTAYGIAMWNDTIWSPVGSGTDTLWGTQCLAIYNGELYAGGANITITSQGDTLRNIYKYNGIKWVGVDGGANNSVLSMGVYQGNLFVGGSFLQVGHGINASRIACYGTTCPLGVGVRNKYRQFHLKCFQIQMIMFCILKVKNRSR